MTVVYGTGTPGVPGSWDREVWYALNRAARVGKGTGRHRWRIEPPFRYGNLLVTSGTPRLPYGRAIGRSNSYLTHLPHTILFAWRRGRLAGRMMAWHCGARTAYFSMMDEPTSPLCIMCAAKAGGRIVAG